MRPANIYLPTDWIRAAYYDEMTRLLGPLCKNYPRTPMAVLEYAECEGIIPKIIRECQTMVMKLAPFPEHNIMDDVAKGRLRAETFDVVIADQVMEHVPMPWVAMWNVSRLLRRGGLAIFGSPWIYPWHPAPKDYWRISLDGYKLLFEEYGFSWVNGGGWGHQKALIYGNIGDAFLSAGYCSNCLLPKRGDPNDPCVHCGAIQWKDNRTVEQADREGLFDAENDIDHAIEVWAIGRKK